MRSHLENCHVLGVESDCSVNLFSIFRQCHAFVSASIRLRVSNLGNMIREEQSLVGAFLVFLLFFKRELFDGFAMLVIA